MRTYIDGVLRFGIPPKFFLSIVKPAKNQEKKVLSTLMEQFADPTMKEMYGTKEELNDTEDFFPFVLVNLTSPIFLQWGDFAWISINFLWLLLILYIDK